MRNRRHRYFIELLNYAGTQLVELHYKSKFAGSNPVGVTGIFDMYMS
jgi:hypothetical protein